MAMDLSRHSPGCSPFAAAAAAQNSQGSNWANGSTWSRPGTDGPATPVQEASLDPQLHASPVMSNDEVLQGWPAAAAVPTQSVGPDTTWGPLPSSAAATSGLHAWHLGQAASMPSPRGPTPTSQPQLMSLHRLGSTGSPRDTGMLQAPALQRQGSSSSSTASGWPFLHGSSQGQQLHGLRINSASAGMSSSACLDLARQLDAATYASSAVLGTGGTTSGFTTHSAAPLTRFGSSGGLELAAALRPLFGSSTGGAGAGAGGLSATVGHRPPPRHPSGPLGLSTQCMHPCHPQDFRPGQTQAHGYGAATTRVTSAGWPDKVPGGSADTNVFKAGLSMSSAVLPLHRTASGGGLLPFSSSSAAQQQQQQQLLQATPSMPAPQQQQAWMQHGAQPLLRSRSADMAMLSNRAAAHHQQQQQQQQQPVQHHHHMISDMRGLTAALLVARTGTGEVGRLLAACSFRPRLPGLTKLVSQLAREGQWAKALELYEALPAAGVAPDTTMANAVISACDKGGQWERALEMFRGMPARGLVHDAITYSTLISALAKGRQWGRSIEVFNHMVQQKVEVDAVTCCALITALDKGGQWQLAEQVFVHMYSSHPRFHQLLASIASSSDPAGEVGGCGLLADNGLVTGVSTLTLSQSFTAEALSALADGGSGAQPASAMEQQRGVTPQQAVPAEDPTTRSGTGGEESAHSPNRVGDAASAAGVGVGVAPPELSNGNSLLRAGSGAPPAELTTPHAAVPGDGASHEQLLPSPQAAAGGSIANAESDTTSCNPQGSPETASSTPSPQQPSTTGTLPRSNSIGGALTRSNSMGSTLTRSNSMRKVAPNRVCCNALLAAYARAVPAQWAKAVQLLRVMAECGEELEPDIVSYNTVIKACGNAGQTALAFELFSQMQQHGITPAPATYSTLIAVAAEAEQWGHVVLAWGWLERAGAAAHITCANAYLTALVQLGAWSGAQRVWALLQGGHWGLRPNTTSFTTIMEGFLKQGQPAMVKQLYDVMMTHHLMPTAATYTHLITAYGQMHLWKEALAVLSHVNRGGSSTRPNASMYAAVFKALQQAALLAAPTEQQELLARTLAAYLEMQQVLPPEEVSAPAALQACLQACATCGSPAMAVNLVQQMVDQHVDFGTTAAVAVEALVQQHAWQLAGKLVGSCLAQGSLPAADVLQRLLLGAAAEDAWAGVRDMLEALASGMAQLDGVTAGLQQQHTLVLGDPPEARLLEELLLMVLLVSYCHQPERGSWQDALALFKQLMARWGPAFAATNGPLYGALLELLVQQGGAAGLMEGVTVCNQAHAAGVMSHYVPPSALTARVAEPPLGSTNSSCNTPSCSSSCTSTLSPASSLQQQQLLLMAGLGASSPAGAASAVLPTAGSGHLSTAGRATPPALLTLSVAGCSPVDVVVLMASWLSQVVNVFVSGGDLHADMLTIIAGPGESAGTAAQRPAPRLTAESAFKSGQAKPASDAVRQTVPDQDKGPAKGPLQGAGAREVVLRVLQGQLPDMLNCSSQQLLDAAAAAGHPALGQVLVSSVTPVSPEHDPLGVLVPTTDLHRVVVVKKATSRIARCNSTST